MMRKISAILIAIVICATLQIVLPNTTEAAVRCSTNAWGQTVCRDDGGSTWRGSTDAWGNQNWRSNTGQSFRCTTNAWGQTVCR